MQHQMGAWQRPSLLWLVPARAGPRNLQTVAEPICRSLSCRARLTPRLSPTPALIALALACSSSGYADGPADRGRADRSRRNAGAGAWQASGCGRERSPRRPRGRIEPALEVSRARGRAGVVQWQCRNLFRGTNRGRRADHRRPSERTGPCLAHDSLAWRQAVRAQRRRAQRRRVRLVPDGPPVKKRQRGTHPHPHDGTRTVVRDRYAIGTIACWPGGYAARR